MLSAVSGFIVGAASSAAILYGGWRFLVRHLPVAYIRASPPENGVSNATLFITNTGLDHLDVRSIWCLFPRGVRVGVQEYRQEDGPLNPIDVPLPIKFQAASPLAIALAPGETTSFDFKLESAARSFSASSRMVIAMTSARFVANKSLMLVKIMQAAAPTNKP